MFDLTGKTALVTGGSRGLGRAIAIALAGQGADVAINYRGNAEAADEVASAIGALGRRSVTVQGDTSAGREACEAIVKAAIDGARLGRHPRQQRRHHARQPPDADGRRGVGRRDRHQPGWTVLDDARHRAADDEGALRPHHQHEQRRRPDGESRTGQLRRRQGRAHRPDQDHGARAGQPRHHLQRHRARPDRDRSDRRPPPAATEALTAATPLGYVGTVDDVAAAAVYFASDEARYVTGQVLGVDGGIVMGS